MIIVTMIMIINIKVLINTLNSDANVIIINSLVIIIIIIGLALNSEVFPKL